MIPSRESHDLLLGHLACLVELGRVPHRVVTDPAHDAARTSMRGERARPKAAEPEVEVRDLAAYVALFGVAS